MKLKERQAESRAERGCQIPFSRREFALLADIAALTLADDDQLASIMPAEGEEPVKGKTVRFETDAKELEQLCEKVLEFLEV